MTTLVMISILGAGLLAYFRLPVSDLPNVDFPTINVSASLPGAEPGNDGVLGRDAAGKAVLDHRRHRVDDLDQFARLDQHHHPVRSLPQHRCRGAGRAGRDLAGPTGSARRTCRLPPSFRKVNPAEQPILMLAASFRIPAAQQGERIRRDADRPAPLHRERCRAGGRLWLAEIRGAREGRSHANSPPAESASTTLRTPFAKPTPMRPPASSMPAQSPARSRRPAD